MALQAKLCSFWLISVPETSNKEKQFAELKGKINKKLNLGDAHPLPMPDLRVGTLDKMMELSDELSKLDMVVGGIVERFAKVLFDFFKAQQLEVFDNNDVGVAYQDYVQRFQWNQKRYPTNMPMYSLHDILNTIQTDVHRFESDLKKNLDKVNEARQSMNARKRKDGNLLTRDISPYIKTEDVVSSENLCTVYVVVPSFSTGEFISIYEKMCQYVIPRSALVLKEDSDFTLYRVVLFRRIADEFSRNAREKRFVVREVDTSSNNDAGTVDKDISNAYSDAYNQLQSLANTGFSETFAAWMHIKVCRLFVESVLRYGLPAKFMTAVVIPHSTKQEKGLRMALAEHYKDLGGNSSAFSGIEENADGNEFNAYVCTRLELKKY